MAEGSKNPAPFLATAERDAKALERERVPWAVAHAGLIRAGLAACRNDRRAAAAILHESVASYGAAEMRLNATAARRRAGQVLGGHPGRLLVKEADAELASQGVQNPSAFAAVFAPWFSNDPEETSTNVGR
jgi:hypothetical protein